MSYETRFAQNPVATAHRLTLTEHSVHYASAKEFRALPLAAERAKLLFWIQESIEGIFP